jgi:CCR4-NOT transcriptional regulation complex NOT5 subunit
VTLCVCINSNDALQENYCFELCDALTEKENVPTVVVLLMNTKHVKKDDRLHKIEKMYMSHIYIPESTYIFNYHHPKEDTSTTSA